LPGDSVLKNRTAKSDGPFTKEIVRWLLLPCPSFRPHLPLIWVAFVNEHHQFPRLGDPLAPWHYRGWLLAYVILIHERCSTVADRWGYHLRTLEAGRLLDEPIPQIHLRTIRRSFA